MAQRVGLSIAEIGELFAELPAEPELADWQRLTVRLMTEADQRIQQLQRVLTDIASSEKLCELPPADPDS